MTEQSKEQAAKVGAYLSRGVTIEDPRKVMPKLLAEVKGWEAFWAGKEKDAITAAGEKSLAAQEYHQIRRFLKIFVTPRLNEVGELQPADQVRMLNLLTPFDTEGGLRDFMLHFFQITEGDGDDLIYDNRDAFERELYVLHDLYKVKKTQEVIDVIRASGGEFPSVMSPEDQRTTLDQLAIILSMMYAQALPSEHRERIRQDISPKYLTARELLKRRESGLLFLYPHVREKYDYRRFFFLIYFKNGLRTKVGTDEQEFKYNFAHFQTLKREFLINWLASSLKGNPRKMELYSQYKLHGKTIRQWVEAHPENEAEYLMQMPAPAFKDTIETDFRSLGLIAAMLALVALALAWAEWRGEGEGAIGGLGFKSMLVIGCFQALALIPGASRSGSTILGGLLLGLRRADAARFSFLLGIPAIFGSGLYQLPKLLQGASADGFPVTNLQLAALGVGLLAAAVSGYASIAFLLRFLNTHTTGVFIVYRLMLAAVVAGLWWLGWVS